MGDFLEDDPFGRVIDAALGGAVHGTDIFDSASGQILDEVIAGISSPKLGDIFNGRGQNVTSSTNSKTGTKGVLTGGTSGQGGTKPGAGFQGSN